MPVPSVLLRAVRKVAAIIGLLSLAVALSACSAIKLGYANLPEISYWWLDGYLDFDDTQRDRVRDDLARVHAWHRAQELPQVVQLLQRAERLAAGSFTAEQACAFEPAVRERLQAVRAQLEPALAANAVGLAAAQLQHLERKYAQRNREFQQQWLQVAREEQLARRAKDVTSRAEMFYGRLEEPQRAVLRQHLAASAWDPAVSLAERQRRQQDTLAVLRQLAGTGASPQEARAQVAGLLDRALAPPQPAARAQAEALRTEGCRLAAALHETATPAQRESAQRRLRAWQRDLSDLAAQP